MLFLSNWFLNVLFLRQQELILEEVCGFRHLTVGFSVSDHPMELFPLPELLQWLRVSTQLVTTTKNRDVMS